MNELLSEADLVELVLLAELHALFPAVVALEEVGGDSPELDQFVLLKPLGQGDIVKVVVGVDGGAQGLGRKREERRLRRVLLKRRKWFEGNVYRWVFSCKYGSGFK